MLVSVRGADALLCQAKNRGSWAHPEVRNATDAATADQNLGPQRSLVQEHARRIRLAG